MQRGDIPKAPVAQLQHKTELKVSQCPLSGSSAAEQTVWNRPAASISRPTTSFEGYRVERTSEHSQRSRWGVH